MAGKAFSFDKQSVQRISRAVIAVENSGMEMRGQSRRHTGGGAAPSEALVVQVIQKQGEAYAVNIFANGRGAASTGQAIMEVLDIHFEDEVPSGTWLIAYPTTLCVISGD